MLWRISYLKWREKVPHRHGKRATLFGEGIPLLGQLHDDPVKRPRGGRYGDKCHLKVGEGCGRPSPSCRLALFIMQPASYCTSFSLS